MIVLDVGTGGMEAARALTSVKLIATRFPGEHELVIRVGQRNLTLGWDWRYDDGEDCLAALGKYGAVTVE